MKFKITLTIFLINTVMFVLIYKSNYDIETIKLLGANHIQSTLNGEWWRLLTSGFLHHSLQHYIGNMLIGIPLILYCENNINNKSLIIIMLITQILVEIIIVFDLPTYKVSCGYSIMIYSNTGMIIIDNVLKQKYKWFTIALLLMVIIGLTNSMIVPNLNYKGHLYGFITPIVIISMKGVLNEYTSRKLYETKNIKF